MSTPADAVPIVIAYDGSDNARHAIRVAASLLRAGSTRVVYMWEPLWQAGGGLAVYGMGNAGVEIEFERPSPPEGH